MDWETFPTSCWFLFPSGHIDHSARVMRVITWNRSFRGLPNNDELNDDFDKEENETHATVLDKLLAWEKKLFEEVKVQTLNPFVSFCFLYFAEKITRSHCFWDRQVKL